METSLEELIKNLYSMPRYPLGAGYDNALEYLKHLLKLEVIEIPSGKEVGTWEVPEEWILKDAWVKDPKGIKIIDLKEDPLCVAIGSHAIRGSVDLKEFRKHLYYGTEEGKISATPYIFKYYDDDWGFCMPKDKVLVPNVNKIPDEGIIDENGKAFVPKTICGLEEGQYEIFIDSERVPGKLKIGVHTIPGKIKNEILLFAHLDHPFQANNNLSGVACLVDLATRIKSDYTIKIIFCPETIGSHAYALTQDISNVEFVIAVDMCGNNNDLLLNNSLIDHKINKAAHLAIYSLGKNYMKGRFRSTIGSDEGVFNDPLIGIPGIMLSRYPFPEYHTSADTPDKIDYDKIKETGNVVEKIINIYERDFIPKRKFKGQLMRSRYRIQSSNKQVNLAWDYLIYAMDGKTSLVELCCNFGLNFDYVYGIMEELIKDGKISRINKGIKSPYQ